MNIKEHLERQKNVWNSKSETWSSKEDDNIVGIYDVHEKFEDYDTCLFQDFDTKGLVALDYGYGPARCIIRYRDRFERVDGVDFAGVIESAKLNLKQHNLPEPNLYVTDGKNIPVQDAQYDVVFSVICL